MSKMENDVNGGSTPASRETGNAQQVAPSQPPVTTSQIVALLVDTQKLVEKVSLSCLCFPDHLLFTHKYM